MGPIVSLTPLEEFKESQIAEYATACALQDPEIFITKIRELSTANNFYVETFLRIHCHELNEPQIPLAIATTGSDGRLEKCSPLSPVELILITPENKNLAKQALNTITKLENLVSKNPNLFFPEIERKQLGVDRVSTNTNKVTKVIPCRALDAQLLAGNSFIFIDYKSQLYTELCTKNFKNFTTSFLNASRKTLSDEISPKQVKKPLAIHAPEGMLITDGQYLKGPKYGLLRSIQYSVDQIFFRTIKCKSISEDEFKTVPPSIIERMNWLRERNLMNLTPRECETLKSHYLTGLQLYSHLETKVAQQEIPPSSNCPVTIQTDSEKLQATLKETCLLVNKLLSPTIGK